MKTLLALGLSVVALGAVAPKPASAHDRYDGRYYRGRYHDRYYGGYYDPYYRRDGLRLDLGYADGDFFGGLSLGVGGYYRDGYYRDGYYRDRYRRGYYDRYDRRDRRDDRFRRR